MSSMQSVCGCRQLSRRLTAHPRAAFTLIEVMIVVAIIGIIIMIAIPTWIRQREMTRSRMCQENLQKIDGAKEQFAMDNALGQGDDPGELADLVGAAMYLKRMPECAAGGAYSLNVIGVDPTCDYDAPDWAPDHSLEFGDGAGQRP